MEVLLRSEFFFTSPDFHSKIRTRLQMCTGCIVTQCTKDHLNDCIDFCMQPCIDFRLKYESSRSALLSSLKDEMLLKCLHNDEQDQCASEVRDQYKSRLATLLSNI